MILRQAAQQQQQRPLYTEFPAVFNRLIDFYELRPDAGQLTDVVDAITREWRQSVDLSPDPSFSAINGNGVPFQFSVSLGARPRSLRFLSEVGAPGMSMVERLRLSSERLRELVALLELRQVVPQLNYLLDRLFPKDPEAVSGWTGGIGIGVGAAAGYGIRLRLYLNQRWGGVAERYARIARVFAFLGRRNSLVEWGRLAEPVSAGAIPYGVSADLSSGGIGRFKVYFAAPDVNVAYLARLLALLGLEHRIECVQGLLERFNLRRPDLRPWCLLPSLEFPQEADQPVGLKLDVSFNHLKTSDAWLDAAITRFVRALAIDVQEYRFVCDALSSAPLSGVSVDHLQYGGLGFDGPEKLRFNVYLTASFERGHTGTLTSGEPSRVWATESRVLPLRRIADRALAVLMGQARDGFREARHVMRFPRRMGFSGATEFYMGDVFQRAVIADSLIDATRTLGLDLNDRIEAEVEYLLSCRRATKVGAWSYFPDLAELPADADTLGQMIRVLNRVGRYAELRSACEPALAILLSDGVHADGSFETWIVPRDGRPEHMLQHRFIDLAWGRGPDCEVMANLLDAMMDYDQGRFAHVISHALPFVNGRQQADGSWSSTWYFGPYYGTYACSRLIARASPASSASSAAADFLWRNQSADGGWGVGGQNSDVLSTSLALLGLVALQGSRLAHDGRVVAAVGFLEREIDAGMHSTLPPLITMSVNRAAGLPGPEIVYSSRSVTMAYCLKSLLALITQN